MDDDNYFNASIERIIFNEMDLIELKKAINNFSTGMADIKQVKKIIIKSRLRILEELMAFIPFYLEQISMCQQSNDSTNLTKLANLKGIKELEEKNKLLEILGNKLNHLHEKIRAKSIIDY